MVSGATVLVLVAVGFLLGLLARGQWRGRKVRVVRLPWPTIVVRREPRPSDVGPAPSQRVLGMTPTAVYVLSDRDDRVLYVGISNSLEHRFRQHADSKPWASQVARVSAHHYPDRYAALAAEFALIHHLRPPHNTAPSGSSDAWTEPRPPIKPALEPWPRARSQVRGALRRAA